MSMARQYEAAPLSRHPQVAEMKTGCAISLRSRVAAKSRRRTDNSEVRNSAMLMSRSRSKRDGRGSLRVLAVRYRSSPRGDADGHCRCTHAPGDIDPAKGIAASLASWLGCGVQPANRGRV